MFEQHSDAQIFPKILKTRETFIKTLIFAVIVGVVLRNNEVKLGYKWSVIPDKYPM